MYILKQVDEEVDFEVGRLDRAGDPGYIVMFTTDKSQRQEFYNEHDQLLAVRNRHKTLRGWSKWHKEEGENANHGRTVVHDVMCLRPRRSGSRYW